MPPLGSIFLLLIIIICDGSSAKIRGRIVGGQEVSILDYPYQVFVEIERTFCGGSIVSQNHIITACHCVLHYSYRPDLIIVWTNTSVALTGGTTYNVKKVNVHPQYDDYSTNYDIAILEVASPIKLGPGVAPVSLPNLTKNKIKLFEGSMVTASGWGYERNDLPEVKKLRAVNLTIIDKVECENIYKDYEITDQMICALSSDDQARGGCQGDSGGPVVSGGAQYGVISWAEDGCADSGFPTVITDILTVREFVKNITGQ